MSALIAPDARRLAKRLRGGIVAHRRTASATAVFGVAAVLFALIGLPLGGGNGGSYPGAGAIGVEGANASNAPPGLQASVGTTRGGADTLSGRRGASGTDARKRRRGAGAANGDAARGRSRLA
jgi:hypothetical protein